LIFTSILLDNWAHLAAYILNIPNPNKFDFTDLVTSDGLGLIAPIWAIHKVDILWLDAIARFYRHKMITHREMPWQISSTRTTNSLDWSFWTPIASGWISEAKQKEIKLALESLSNSVGLPSPIGLHDHVYLLLDNIALLNKKNREALRKVT